MTTINFSFEELSFLCALLTADRQTALQLLAAEHAYRPSLLPKLEDAHKELKRKKAEQQ
jgi:hypothetical protein